MCEKQLDEISEEIELLHIEVDSDKFPDGPGREHTALASRNVLRKQRHWERQLAAKKSKRKEEKQRRKLNREQHTGANGDSAQLTKRVLKAITRERLAEARCTGLKLCVDLSMTDCMSDKEISRLAGQLRRLYGSNRKSTRPFHVLLTELTKDSRLYRECIRMNAGFLSYTMDIMEQSCLDLFPPETIVYLTPDAERALESVDADKVYVLGGLVDESIQKDLMRVSLARKNINIPELELLCLDISVNAAHGKVSLCRATELSVRTARLPIDEYMVKRDNSKNFHSKILAINQVFDILLAFCHTGSWTEALAACFPLGKGYVVPDVSSVFKVAASQS